DRVLRYMKQPVRHFDADHFSTEGCAAVVISSAKLGIVDVTELDAYVENGGYAFLTTTPDLDDSFYQLYRKMGVRTAGNYSVENSVELISNVLIGEKGLTLNEAFISNMSIQVELEDDTRVLAQTASRVPLLWESRYGQGKFMVFN